MLLKRGVFIGVVLHAMALVGFAAPRAAEPLMIHFDGPNGLTEIKAEEMDRRVWVDFLAIAGQFGAISENSKDGVMVYFSSHTVLLKPDGKSYRIKDKATGHWQTFKFERPSIHEASGPLVLVDEIPKLCRSDFSYHRQKRLLAVDDPDQSDDQDERRVAVGYLTRDQVTWLSLQDITKALDLVLFSAQANRYSMVLPDFSILELRVGDSTIYKQDVLFARLADPFLIIDGSPYLSVRSLNAAFGVDMTWDRKAHMLILPARYGRHPVVKFEAVHRLRYLGYTPQPFHFSVEELGAYYQEPQPAYVADHAEPYESVRDFLTNEPILIKGNPEDRFSGHGVFQTNGNSYGIPFEGKGSIEKVGGTSRVTNGTAQWGFPMLQIRGGREYATFGGLTGQLSLVDDVSVSHSNDHFGDDEVDPEYQVRAGYGEDSFSLFLSTLSFGQTVRLQQSYVTGGFDSQWSLTSRQKISAKVDSYAFKNKVVGVSASYFDEEFLREILGDTADVSVDPRDQEALTKTVITDRHTTTLMNVLYGFEDIVELSGTMGLSQFKDPTTGDRKTDTDQLGKVILGNRKRHVELSHERVGPDYRSVGDPTRYRDRTVDRVSPYFDILRQWKVYGDYRQEKISSLKDLGIAPYTNKSAYAVNYLTFKPASFRLSLNDYDSTLYGRRRSGDLTATKYLGRHSIDIGGGPAVSDSSQGVRISRSITGRAAIQMLGTNWKFSLGEEYTHLAYNLQSIRRHESLSTAVFNWRRFRSFFQYKLEPKYYLQEDVLHTGYGRLGFEIKKNKAINVFYSGTSLRQNLSHPVVWRSGIELGYDF